MSMEFRYQVGDEIVTVSIEKDGEGYRVSVGENEHRVTVASSRQSMFNLEVDGQRRRTVVAQADNQRYVALNGDVWHFERVTDQSRRRRSGGSGTGSGALEASMPGQVLDVLVSVGDVVSAGDTLILLEAMKMELRITAPTDGTVKAIHCTAGETVNRGKLLVEIETDKS